MALEYPSEAGKVLVDLSIVREFSWTLFGLLVVSPWILAILAPPAWPLILIADVFFGGMILLGRLRMGHAPGLLAVCENGLVVTENGALEFVPWRAIASVSRRLARTGPHSSLPIYDVNFGKTVSMSSNRLSRSGRVVEQAVATIVSRRGLRWVGSIAMNEQALEVLRTNHDSNSNPITRVEQRGKDTYADLTVSPERLQSSDDFAVQIPGGKCLKMKLASELAGKTLKFAGQGSQDEGDLYIQIVVHMAAGR